MKRKVVGKYSQGMGGYLVLVVTSASLLVYLRTTGYWEQSIDNNNISISSSGISNLLEVR